METNTHIQHLTRLSNEVQNLLPEDTIAIQTQDIKRTLSVIKKIQSSSDLPEWARTCICPHTQTAWLLSGHGTMHILITSNQPHPQHPPELRWPDLEPHWKTVQEITILDRDSEIYHEKTAAEIYPILKIHNGL